MYHVYSIASITINFFIPIYLDVINRKVVLVSDLSQYSPTSDLIKIKRSLLHLIGHVMGFNLIYWMDICG